MGRLEQLLADAKQSNDQVADVVKRFRMLTISQRRSAFPGIVDAMEDCNEESPSADSPSQLVLPTPSKIEQAEELVRARPGITSRQVGEQINQSTKTAGITLRQIARRGVIENRGRAWYPTKKPPESNADEGLAGIILRVMSDGKARSQREVLDEARSTAPNEKPNSLYAAFKRLVSRERIVLSGKSADGDDLFKVMETR